MKVRPVPGEAERFFVSSDTRPEVDHIVDTAWVECPGDMPRPMCSCEESMAKGRFCKHLMAVGQYLQGNKVDAAEYRMEDR